jgi:hypothetical protein
MSVLETPRIYFKGEVAWDPITTNNYNTNYDEGTGEAILPAAKDRVKQFRDQAIGQVTTMGNWNPHGTHRATLFDCAVCGFDVGTGVRTDDPFVTGAVNCTGMLVDLEPFGSFSSQIFFDALRFGVDGGYRILAPRSSRIIARYINFARNRVNAMIAGIASVVWQTSFATADGLRIDAFDSPALTALAAALEAPGVQGLTVRFNTYRTIYYDDATLRNGGQPSRDAAAALAAKLNGGGFQPNPARSVLVGVVGLWRRNEPAHEPGDRALAPPTPNAPLATAFVRAGRSSVTLDLGNSVPEVDEALAKKDLGPLTLVSVDPGSGAVTRLASFDYSQYNRAAYEASAGVLSAPLPPNISAGGDLQLLDADGGLLLLESGRRAVPEIPNLYLGEGESTTASFQVYDHGAPAGAGVPATMYKMSSDGGSIDSSSQLATDAEGRLSLPLTGVTGGGIVAYVPTLNDGEPPPSQGINTQTNTYLYVRSLPADADVSALAPTWDNVYAKVLANWNAMAPCMDNWLNLDDPAQVRAYGPMLKHLTDPANFEIFRFMPVTRDMTPGGRDLLYRFLDTPAGDAPAAASPASAPERAPEPEPKVRGRAAVSRAMRRP